MVRLTAAEGAAPQDLWNVIRERRTPKDKRSALVTELCDLVRGKVRALRARS